MKKSFSSVSAAATLMALVASPSAFAADVSVPANDGRTTISMTGGFASANHDLTQWTDNTDVGLNNGSPYYIDLDRNWTGGASIDTQLDQTFGFFVAIKYGTNHGSSTVLSGDEPYTAYFKCESDRDSAPACAMEDTLRYMSGDLALSYSLDNASSVNAKLIGGIRIAQLDMSRSGNNIGFGGDMDDEWGNLKEKSSFSGAGPSLGFSFDAPSAGNVSFFGSALGGIMFGERKYSVDSFNQYEDDGASGSRTSNKSIVFGEAEAGLSYHFSEATAMSVGYNVKWYGKGSAELGTPNDNESMADYNSESLMNTPTDTTDVLAHGAFLRLAASF